MNETANEQVDSDPVEAVVERIFGEGIGAFHLMTCYLGIRLGLFRALAGAPGLTAAQLGAATGVDERYAVEWLQAEAIAGLVVADGDDFATASCHLADGVEPALVDELSPAYVGGIPLALAAVGTALTQLPDAYRSGAGVSMDVYGPEVIAAQAAFNRPAFANELAADWLPKVPDVQRRLLDASAPARVADVGCGAGWAAIEIAKAYPGVTVDGFDADPASVEQAQRNAVAEGVADRVRFHIADVTAGTYGDGDYDVVFFFECVHDFGRPVEALAAARKAVRATGTVIVMDERTADRPQIGDPIETFFAVVSATWCLPQSRVVADCEAPGTVMRPATLESFARRAGWAGFEVLPIEHPVFRFYRLIG